MTKLNSKWRPRWTPLILESTDDNVVPNQALSIPQILQRYRNGQTIPENKKLTYTYDTDDGMREPHLQDINEMEENSEANAQKIKNIQKNLKAKKDKEAHDLAEKLKNTQHTDNQIVTDIPTEETKK